MRRIQGQGAMSADRRFEGRCFAEDPSVKDIVSPYLPCQVDILRRASGVAEKESVHTQLPYGQLQFSADEG